MRQCVNASARQGAGHANNKSDPPIVGKSPKSEKSEKSPKSPESRPKVARESKVVPKSKVERVV